MRRYFVQISLLADLSWGFDCMVKSNLVDSTLCLNHSIKWDAILEIFQKKILLLLADTHYDPYYAEGSNADCNEPLCCRLTNGRPLTPAAAAGKWGDYRKCDTPKRTVDHMVRL